jgi:sec-independent protein translocase protein TatC
MAASQTDPNLKPPAGNTEPAADKDPGGRMSFFDHLVELRTRLIHAAIAIVLGTGVGLLLSKHVITFVVQPMYKALIAAGLGGDLYYTSPAGYVSLVISLGLYLGIAIAMPYVLYQVWLFVAPGLFKHERNAVAGFIVSSMFLFLCGLAFAYFVMLPISLKFLIGFANQGPIKPLISINEYFDLTLMILLGLGVVFELPVLIFILSLFGIVTPKFLMKNFRYAMVIITVAAAIIAPPDATTMLVFMAPMIVLYFVGVLVSYVVLRRKQAADVATEEAH